VSDGELTEAQRALLPGSLEAKERDRERAQLGGEYYRLDFIRRAAIAIYGALPFPQSSVRPVTECAAMCWQEARALWDAKPEDC
jgi:hypothetical protein